MLRLCYQPNQDELHPSKADRKLVVGPHAAAGRDRRRRVAARIPRTSDRSNRIAMNWYSTDNRSLHVPLSDIPEVAYTEFHDELAARLARPQYHVAHYFALPRATGCASSACCSTTPGAACSSPRTPRSTTTRPPPPPRAHSPRPPRRPLAAPPPPTATTAAGSIDNYPLLHDGGTLAARSERRADPRRNHRTGGLPLHLQRRAGPPPRNRAGLPAPRRGGRVRRHGEPAAAGVSGRNRRGRQRRGPCLGVRRRRRTPRGIPRSGVSGDRARHRPRTRTDGHADRRHGGALHGRRLPARAGGLRGAAHHDDQHHAGVVRQPASARASSAPAARTIRSTPGRPARSAATSAKSPAATTRCAATSKSSPSLLARFEQCGIVPREEMLRIGGVGQAARASGPCARRPAPRTRGASMPKRCATNPSSGRRAT